MKHASSVLEWLDVDLTDPTKHMLEIYVSELVAHVFEAACLGIFSEIDGMVAYCHGAARLAVCCRDDAVGEALEREWQFVEERSRHFSMMCDV